MSPNKRYKIIHNGYNIQERRITQMKSKILVELQTDLIKNFAKELSEMSDEEILQVATSEHITREIHKGILAIYEMIIRGIEYTC